uniref:Uncharacterized protein n=1 Tax=Arundo donax TaxID=35708 RepID=A0A0A8YH95_ARUDO
MKSIALHTTHLYSIYTTRRPMCHGVLQMGLHEVFLIHQCTMFSRIRCAFCC